MARKYARRHPESFFHVVCPLCGFACVRRTPYAWCSGCYAEYDLLPSGRVRFDNKRRSEKYLWAIALQKAGGMRMGNLKEDDDA